MLEHSILKHGMQAPTLLVTESVEVIHIPFMCLSVFGGIQPGPIASYVSRMRSGDDNDDGFLQRFQVMVWPNSIPWKPYNGNLDDELERDIKKYLSLAGSARF